LVIGLAIQGPGRAAVDTMTAARPSMELLVFEHPDCTTTCQAFRSRIAPRYRQSPHGAEAPLRFVDITGADADRIALNAPIRMVPTVVVMKNGREVDRIAGYWGPDNFFKMVTYIIGKAE
jgi:thioredoxin-like negative regulator of GroEL